MRVLLDENLPHDLIAALAVHTVSTVQGKGWAGLENGELLRRAIGHADAFVTWTGGFSTSRTSQRCLSGSF